MVFPVILYGCESWTVKKAERRRIDAFELWCWRRLLRVPWTARRSNQSILKETRPGCSLEGMMLKLNLQYFGHLMRRVDSLEKTDARRDWRHEEKETTEDEMAGWHHRLNGHEFEWTPGVGDGQGGVACCNSWGRRVGHDWPTELNVISHHLIIPVSLQTGLSNSQGWGSPLFPRHSPALASFLFSASPKNCWHAQFPLPYFLFCFSSPMLTKNSELMTGKFS